MIEANTPLLRLVRTFWPLFILSLGLLIIVAIVDATGDIGIDDGCGLRDVAGVGRPRDLVGPGAGRAVRRQHHAGPDRRHQRQCDQMRWSHCSDSFFPR